MGFWEVEAVVVDRDLRAIQKRLYLDLMGELLGLP